MLMRRPHALVVPTVWQGHINPLMQLAQHLSACHGFQITFVDPHHNQQHSQLLPPNACSAYPDIQLVALPSPAEPPPSPSPSTAHARSHNAPSASFKNAIDHSTLLPFIPFLEHLISRINLSSNPLTCIIADPFLYWLPSIARSAHVPSLVAFFPSSAANLLLLHHAPSLLSKGLVNPDGSIAGSADIHTAIPRLSAIQSNDVSWIAGLKNDDIHVMFDLVISISKQLKEFDAILVNTYQELESEALNGLAESDLQVAPIGPLLLLETHNNVYNVPCSSLWKTDKDCLQWLEGRPNSSVVYIAFGSLATYNVRDFHELALGIEASHLAFVWVLGPLWMDRTDELFPTGFLDRTQDHALFISWAPQSMVLSHPSIGVFVTHCGWNSTMEAISNGVPMLTWPCLGDQPLNSQYITHEWKIGIPLSDRNFVMHQGPLENDSDSNLVHREGVKSAILSIMVEKEGINMRERIGKLKEEAKLALEKNSGRSFLNLHNLIQHITGLMM